ncbi:hypothetical protein DL770_010460 [Monosporascus sp. CRB-9-2]|nr:hypothetical protein DL770_010460 [Monosporascus sp. CRB-9-2]
MLPEKGFQHPESQVKSALSKYVREVIYQDVFALPADPRASSRSATNFDGLCGEEEQENNAIESTKPGPHRKMFAEHAKSAEPDSFPCKVHDKQLQEAIMAAVQQIKLGHPFAMVENDQQPV